MQAAHQHEAGGPLVQSTYLQIDADRKLKLHRKADQLFAVFKRANPMPTMQFV